MEENKEKNKSNNKTPFVKIILNKDDFNKLMTFLYHKADDKDFELAEMIKVGLDRSFKFFTPFKFKDTGEDAISMKITSVFASLIIRAMVSEKLNKVAVYDDYYQEAVENYDAYLKKRSEQQATE